MKKKRPHKIRVSFTDEEWNVITAAVKRVNAGNFKVADEKYLARNSLIAVAFEVLRTGGLPLPIAVTWRDMPAEHVAKLNGIPLGPKDTIPPWAGGPEPDYEDGSDGDVVWSRF